MIRKDAPLWFSESLKNYDKNLRIRWSYETGKFAIEEKCNRSFLPKPVRYIKDGKDVREVLDSEFSDRYIRYHDSYSTIMFCKAPSLFVIEQIRKMDMANKYKEIKEQVEEIEKKKEASDERHLSNEREAMANEFYDTIKTKIGERTFMNSSKCSDSDWY